jgi:hypothetical protein
VMIDGVQVTFKSPVDGTVPLGAYPGGGGVCREITFVSPSCQFRVSFGSVSGQFHVVF